MNKYLTNHAFILSNFLSWILHLIQKDQINHNSYKFRFELKDPKQNINAQTTSYIFLRNLNFKSIYGREYTIIEEGEGYFIIIVKIYRQTEMFPKGGEFTQELEKCPIGSDFFAERQYGDLIYQSGLFILRPCDNAQEKKFNKVLLVCGGSGITPAYQIIKEVCKNKGDKTKLFLLYANKQEQDIWLKNELDKFASQHQNKFKVFYTIDQVIIYINNLTSNNNWNGFIGHINEQMIINIFPIGDPKSLGFVCGPKGFNQNVIQIFQSIGFENENIIEF